MTEKNKKSRLLPHIILITSFMLIVLPYLAIGIDAFLGYSQLFDGLLDTPILNVVLLQIISLIMAKQYIVLGCIFGVGVTAFVLSFRKI